MNVGIWLHLSESQFPPWVSQSHSDVGAVRLHIQAVPGLALKKSSVTLVGRGSPSPVPLSHSWKPCEFQPTLRFTATSLFSAPVSMQATHRFSLERDSLPSYPTGHWDLRTSSFGVEGKAAASEVCLASSSSPPCGRGRVDSHAVSSNSKCSQHVFLPSTVLSVAYAWSLQILSKVS